MNLNIPIKIEYLKTIGDCHMQILRGATKIQLYSLMIQLSNIDIKA